MKAKNVSDPLSIFLSIEQDAPLFDAAIVDVVDKYILILIRAHYLVCDFVLWNLIFDQFSAVIQPLNKNETEIFKLDGRANSLNRACP